MSFIITVAQGENSDSKYFYWSNEAISYKKGTYIDCIFWPMFVGLVEAMVASLCAYWKTRGLHLQTEDGISRGFKRFSRSPIWGFQKMQLGHKAWIFQTTEIEVECSTQRMRLRSRAKGLAL
jgi:hypothetical protein